MVLGLLGPATHPVVSRLQCHLHNKGMSGK
jgi:hypothetical protein